MIKNHSTYPKKLKGVGVSPGIIIGKAHLVDRSKVKIKYQYIINDEHVTREADRFKDALATTEEQLAELKKTMPDHVQEHAFILDSLGWVHFRLGNNEEALKYLRQALESRPDAEIAAHLGEVLWEIGEKEEAREIWKRGTELGPDNSVLRDTIDRLSESQSSEAAPLHDPSQITLWVATGHFFPQFAG